MRRFSLLIALLVSSQAFSGETAWQSVLTGPINIKNREMEGSSVKEVWAEYDMKAPLRDIQDSLLDIPSYRGWMPFARDSKNLGEKQADGSFYSYIMLDLPIVGKRDYILRTWLKESATPESKGVLKYNWVAYPEFIPVREGVQRIKLNTGSWEVTPNPDGKSCHAVYKFAIDPGGWLPGFAVNLGNERGVVDTFTAVEKEALRRRDARMATAK